MPKNEKARAAYEAACAELADLQARIAAFRIAEWGADLDWGDVGEVARARDSFQELAEILGVA